MHCPAIPETPITKGIVAGICAYEVTAIGSGGRIPTITTIVGNHPAVGVVLVAALALHFWAPVPTLPIPPQ